MKRYYLHDEYAYFMVSKSERCLDFEFEGTLEEIITEYNLEAYVPEDVAEVLADKDLFLFREELIITRNGKVVAKGDMIKDLFDYLEVSLRYGNHDTDPYIFALDTEGTIDYINNNTDFNIKCNYDMVV